MKFQIFALIFAIGYAVALDTTPFIQLPNIMYGGLVLFGILVMLILQFEKNNINKNPFIFILACIITIGVFAGTQYYRTQKQIEIQKEYTKLNNAINELKHLSY